MREYKYFILMLFLIVFQASVLSRLTVFGVTADLPVAFAVLLAFMRGPREGFWYGALAGLSADALSGERFVFAAAVPLSCFILGVVKEKFFSEDEPVMYFFVFAGTMFSYYIAARILAAVHGEHLSAVFAVMVGVSLINTLFTPYLTPLISKAERTNDGHRLKI